MKAPMPRQKAQPDQWPQRILKRIALEDIPLSPSDVPNHYTDNIINKSFSLLFGELSAGKFKPVKVTTDGKLQVSATPGVYEDYETHEGTAADSYTSTNTFEATFSHVTILIEDNDAKISFRDKKGVWKNDIAVTVGWHTFDFSGTGIRIKNRVSGSNAKYQIVLWR